MTCLRGKDVIEREANRLLPFVAVEKSGMESWRGIGEESCRGCLDHIAAWSMTAKVIAIIHSCNRTICTLQSTSYARVGGSRSLTPTCPSVQSTG